MMEKSPKAPVKGHSEVKKDKEIKKEIKEEVKEEPEEPELFCICRTTDSTSFMM